jgi:BirA family biotin operon repressor/biotin-[acetyl-CoA-carboxylase] ligase
MSVKEKVLCVLEENRGASVSGSGIARTAGVTRSAVWKAVAALRREGYRIYASTNKGYCLSADNDLLSVRSVSPLLRTECLGRNLDVFKTIDSTNNFAKSLAALGAAHGTAVISEAQTAAKGRAGKPYHTPAGMGVYMSVILRTELTAEHAPLITSCAAVAVSQAIEKTADVDCKIKWVNDIYSGGKKLCGILTEATTDMERGALEYAVVGVGVNVRNESFPQELRGTATSILIESGRNVSRSALAAEILNSLEENLRLVGQAGFAAEYRKRSNLLGRRILVTRGDRTFRADCLDVDDMGRLIVKTDDGVKTALTAGSVRLEE